MAHILIVDDDPKDIETVKKILEGQGHQTSSAENGEQGIQKAQELKPYSISYRRYGFPLAIPNRRPPHNLPKQTTNWPTKGLNCHDIVLKP